MQKKSFAVIGLGQFGMSLAVTLAEGNYDVLAIDDNEDNVNEIAEKVTYAVRADVREPGILKELGVQNVDVAIIGIGRSIEASITATMQAKELGVPFVIAKAVSDLHGRILDKIGADKIIHPEQEMGMRLARNLMSSSFLDVFELSSEFSMVEFKVPENWVGKGLAELGIRSRHKLNIVGIKKNENLNVEIDPKMPLEADMILIAIGKNKDLNKVTK